MAPAPIAGTFPLPVFDPLAAHRSSWSRSPNTNPQSRDHVKAFLRVDFGASRTIQVLPGLSSHLTSYAESMTTPPETMPRHQLERKLRSSRILNVVLGAAAASGLLFGGVQWLAADQDVVTVEADDDSSVGEASYARLKEGDPMAIGAIDAPIVLSEWTDYRCPFCAVYSRDTLPQIVKEYVDAGKVRIEVHDVAFFGEESARAAVAARAAGEQGKYFEFMDAVYQAAPESGHPELPVDELIAFAKAAGVPDLVQFEADMQREDLVEAVRQSTTNAQQLGVTSVPFFAVGGQALSGAQPIQNFREFLDQQLAKQAS